LDQEEIMHARHQKRIAIVEDEPSHATLLKFNLERIGYNVEHFDVGEEFLNHPNPNSFNLVIISVQLGDIDGLKLCETIRDKGINIPILFLTTSINHEQCSCVHAMDILNKPFSLKELFNKVQQILA
jgi:DNA-binding response OmpR family regulator